MSELPIFYEQRPIGMIHVSDDGPTFSYDPTWLQTRGAFPISVLMPLSSRPVSTNLFLPWAANLLPEAGALRAISIKLGASSADVIGILKEIGRDTAGAISIGSPGLSTLGSRKLIKTSAQLERIINELPMKPFLVGEDGVSMSLAGVQSKIGVALDGDKIFIPVDGAPSTHILKPDSNERLFGSVQNEAFCMVLAAKCGLKAPTVTTGVAGSRTYLLVARYDRLQQRDRWRRLHQEDFCQGLGRTPDQKYEANASGVKGPTLAQMFTLTRNVMDAQSILSLLDYLIFNVAVCNTDAHAKNYSILISGQRFTLAPIYDVMCGAVYQEVTLNLAQKIAGKNRGDHIAARHWERFAEECGLNRRLVLQRVERVCSAVLRHLPDALADVNAMPAGPHPLMKEIAEAIKNRATRLLSNLKSAPTPTTQDESKPQTSAPSLTLAREYITAIRALIGDPDKFPSVYARLVSDAAIKKPDALHIAQELLGKIPRSTTKRAAFEKIWAAHSAAVAH